MKKIDVHIPQMNKKMLERLIIIHNAIKSGIFPNNERLRKLYCQKTGYSKVGEATINRDIDTLRTYFHVPLEFDRIKGGYYYSNDNYDFALNDISTEEVFYLSAAKTLLSSFEGSPVYKAISGVIDFVADTQGVGKSSLIERIAVPPTPRFVTDENVWKLVLNALQENRVIEFEYTGRWNAKTMRRRVRPYQLLMADGQCYLFGWSEERAGERLFALGKIKSPELTADTFELPSDFDFSSRCGGGKFGAFAGEDSVDFVIDFYAESREYVKSCNWADNQTFTEFEDEDKTRISFSSTQVLKVQEWVLSQGANAVPVSPEWFVEEWKETVQKMAERAILPN